jgi:spermidine synthase
MADRGNPALLLGPVVIAGAVLAVASPALVYVMGPSISGEGPGAIVGLAAVGFFLPAAVLSTVTPIAAKLSLESLDSTGSVVGQLSALSTAGALFGTFITGFVLIAAVPSQPITWVVGAVLFALGVGLTLVRGRGAIVSAIVVFAFALVGASALAAPCDYETAYSCAVVGERSDRETVRVLVLDTFVNSVVDIEDPTFLSSRYARAIDAVVEAQAPEGSLDIAYIGGGGYTLPRYYEETRRASATVLELDAELPGIAESDLGLVPGDWLTTTIGDARLTLPNLSPGSHDVVIGDAFSGRSVPWHLTTSEFLDDIREVLRPDGFYVMNLIDHPPLAFARAEIATIAAAFPYVAVVAPASYLAGERGGNFVVVGSLEPLDADAIGERATDGETVIVGDEVVEWTGTATTLTDDFAPADQLLSRP